MRETQTEGYSIKHVAHTLEKCQRDECQRKAKELSQSKED